MISIRKNSESYIIDFLQYEDWQGFDSIVIKLINEFDAKVIEKLDGPDSRVWNIEIKGLPFTLHNNPYGNYLKAVSFSSIQYLANETEKLNIAFS